MSKYILSRMNWEKAYKDYETLRVGNENLLKNLKKGIRLLSNNQNTAPIEVREMDDFFSVKRLEGSNHLSTYTNKFIENLVNGIDEHTTTWEVRCSVSCTVRFTREGVGETTKILEPNVWTEIKKTYVPKNDAISRFQGLYSPDIPIDVWLDYRKPKLEIGRISTPYTPNPSDINAQPFPAQVAQDMYQAKTGNWVKAEKDYEVLKVGKTNLLIENGMSIQRWSSGNYELINNQIVKVVGAVSPSQRIEFEIKENTLKNNVVYTFILWGHIPSSRGFRNPSNANMGLRDFDENMHNKIAPAMMQFTVTDTTQKTIIRLYTDNAPVGERQIIDRIKLVDRGVSLNEKWTPSPESINASPFSAKLANDYATQQSEINELRNAILQLGGK